MTTANPVKVSVIVPVYNVEKYLAECLDSLINQTLQDIEIICVDDCSTDNSAQILREYAARDGRIKNIFLCKNGGQAHARNVAIECANGKYISLVDSDDMLILNALEVLYNIADTNDIDLLRFLPDVIADKEYNKSVQGIQNYYHDSPENLIGNVFSGEELFKQLLSAPQLLDSACINFVKTDFLRAHDIYFPEGYIHEDRFFAIKALVLAKKATVINDRLYIYRRRPDSSMTSTASADNIRHICGHAAVIGLFQAEISDGTYTAEQQMLVNELCTESISKMIQHIQKTSLEERQNLLEQLSSCPGGNHWLLFAPFLYKFCDIAQNTTGNIKIKKLQSKVNTLKSKLKKSCQLKKSFSYRLGRALTWLPRKIRGGVRCLKQHGVAYTCKRIFQKIGILFK